MYVRVYSSIDEIDAGAWDAIVGRDAAICSHAYLKAVEGSAINGCVFRYPVVYDDAGRVLAHTCVFSISMDMALFAQGAARAVVVAVRRVFPRFLTLRMLECGTPVALGRQITLRPDADAGQVLPRLVAAVEAVAAQAGLNYLLFRDYREEDRARFDALTAQGYSPLPNLPEAELEVRWRSFDAYLADMRSSYRRKVRLNLSRIAGRGIRSELVNDFGHLAERFVDQWRYIYDRASEYRREILTAAFYRNIDAHLPNSRALVFYRHDRIIGHCLLLFEDDVLRWMYVGKDGEESEDLYPFMLYEIVRHAIQAGMRRIKLGITTYIAKTDLGAELVPLHMYMKHRTRLFPKLSPWIFRRMTRLPPPLEKSVFKRDTATRPHAAATP